MSLAGFPIDLIRFIRANLPDYPAAVVLVTLARNPDRPWTAEDIRKELGAAIGQPQSIVGYLTQFESRGLVATDPAGGYRYAPSDAGTREHVATLVQAYDHRPVTFIRVLYQVSGTSIESFARAFRLHEEELE